MKPYDRNDYEPGKWNVICDRCGNKYKSDKIRDEWTGLLVCHGEDTNNCWDPRPHPPIKAKPEHPYVPYILPMTDQFVAGPACPIWGVRAYSGLAIVGCAIAGLDDIAPDILASMKGERQS